MDWSILAIFLVAALTIVSGCSREPPATTAPKSAVGENYMISVDGNPETYTPGQKYKVSLIANHNNTFTGFMLGLESEENGDVQTLGSFEIANLTDIRYSSDCPYIVENTNTNLKTEIEVVWIAPTAANKSCVLFKATIIQNHDIWFMDDDGLTQKICNAEEENDIAAPCDPSKTKYTLNFELSLPTNPKIVPKSNWRTDCRDLNGVPHTADYHFRHHTETARSGLTKTDKDEESDLNNQVQATGDSGLQVHTQIKLVSLISSQTFAGISTAINIAANGNGSPYRSDDQYKLPSDSPNDFLDSSENEYQSSVCATTVWSDWHECNTLCGPGKQYRMREFKNPILAKRFKCNIKIRQEEDCVGYQCNSFDEGEAYEMADELENAECAVSNWTEWSLCSVKCGTGTQRRTRHYLNPRAKKKCQKINRIKLNKRRNCIGVDCGEDIEINVGNNDEDGEYLFNSTQSLLDIINDDFIPNENCSQNCDDIHLTGGSGDGESRESECHYSDWLAWTPCSASCGNNSYHQTTRYLLNTDLDYKCQERVRIEKCLVEPCPQNDSDVSDIWWRII